MKHCKGLRIFYFMDKYRLLIVFLFALQSCQLIVLETKSTTKNAFIANRNSPEGILNLYLMQLDSNDAYSATFLKTDTLGRYLFPSLQYEMLYNSYRLGRQIGGLPITRVKYDTISAENIILDVEFDYIRNVKFLTSKIDNKWYIAEISSRKTYNFESNQKPK